MPPKRAPPARPVRPAPPVLQANNPFVAVKRVESVDASEKFKEESPVPVEQEPQAPPSGQAKPLNVNNPFGQAPEVVQEKPPVDPNNPYAHEPPLLEGKSLFF